MDASTNGESRDVPGEAEADARMDVDATGSSTESLAPRQEVHEGERKNKVEMVEVGTQTEQPAVRGVVSDADVDRMLDAVERMRARRLNRPGG